MLPGWPSTLQTPLQDWTVLILNPSECHPAARTTNSNLRERERECLWGLKDSQGTKRNTERADFSFISFKFRHFYVYSNSSCTSLLSFFLFFGFSITLNNKVPFKVFINLNSRLSADWFVHFEWISSVGSLKNIISDLKPGKTFSTFSHFFGSKSPLNPVNWWVVVDFNSRVIFYSIFSTRWCTKLF